MNIITLLNTNKVNLRIIVRVQMSTNEPVGYYKIEIKTIAVRIASTPIHCLSNSFS